MLDCEKLKRNYIRIDICVFKLSDNVSEKKKTFRSSFLISLFRRRRKIVPLGRLRSLINRFKDEYAYEDEI